MDDFLCVGAGLAGLACAADLRAAGARVRLIEQEPRVGGRAATTRVAGLPIDHGAQYFTARAPRFQALVERGLADDWIRVWSHGFPLWRDGSVIARPDTYPRYACPDGMGALPQSLARGLTIQTGARAVALARTGDSWSVATDRGETFRARRLILNLPPAPLRALADPLLSPNGRARLEAVTLESTWALFGPLERDLDVDWPALEFEDHPTLAWVARDHTRRRGDAPPALVVHARGSEVRAALHETLGVVADERWQLRPWPHARPLGSLGAPFFEDDGLYACGDWCEGGRIESALLSGWALAERLSDSFERN